MGVGEQVGHVVDRRGSRLGLVERGQHLVQVALAAELGHAGVDLVAGGDAAGEGLQVLPIAETEELHHPPPDRLRRRRDRHPTPVAAAPGAPGHRVGEPGTHAGLEVAGRAIGRGEGSHALQQRVEQVHVDHLPHPGPQRRHDGEGADDGGDLVGQRHRREQGCTVGLAVDRGEARHGLGQGGEAGPGGVGTVLAEPGDPADHQPWVALEQDVRSDTEAFQGPRPEVLDEHIGVGGQVKQGLAAGGGLEVQGDAALVAADHLPIEARAVAGIGQAHGSGRVSGVGPLHLQHVGAEVSEVAGGAGSGHDGGQVQHPQPGQRPMARRRCPGGVLSRHGA
jgi:hypothetical protein